MMGSRGFWGFATARAACTRIASGLRLSHFASTPPSSLAENFSSLSLSLPQGLRIVRNSINPNSAEPGLKGYDEENDILRRLIMMLLLRLLQLREMKVCSNFVKMTEVWGLC
jgi:hypothetical protein